MTPRYAELQTMSCFSFLEGASHPDELALTAAALGLDALGLTDRASLAGVVRAHLAAKTHGLRFVVGCRLDLDDGDGVLAYPTDRAAYGRLSRLLTLGKRRATKGSCQLTRADVAAHAQGMVFALLPPAGGANTSTETSTETSAETLTDTLTDRLATWREIARDRLYLVASCHHDGGDARRLAWLARTAALARVPLLATNDALYHTPARRPLADVMTCIRHHTTIDAAGWRLAANAERHLKPAKEMARLFRRHPEALAHTLDIVDACRFSLSELRYEYPDEVADDGASPHATLIRLTWEGAAKRYPGGVPDKVRDAINHELVLVDQLGYAPYFLTVHDIVRFANARGILCQGRGSAANSAVCYCLGITAVDPANIDLLFERFVSAARDEPPDIDVDFEHERREEVIQYIYQRFGRDRAGLAATVVRYRARGAIREVGKALGLSEDTTARLAGGVSGWGRDAIKDEWVRRQGLAPDTPRLRLALDLAGELIGFPRHLSQHVGGFVITRGRLDELCPILNAAMDGRTTIEWDKDDIDALGILKIDVLALGMLTCVRKAFELIHRHHGQAWTLATLPPEDAAVYDMLCRGDSVGVFQVESRAQMSMLPRLKPRRFYDLVIEVAIVRPGPIQGGMVHPNLRRRAGVEPVEYPSPELRQVLEKTLGVPLFQEQAMRIAMVAAGFTPEEADRLRRAMATFRHTGIVHTLRDRFVDGMIANGYDPAFAERCFHQIEGFGEYGFPESHAASFALLVYASAWLKRHHPAAFAAALLNSQPMGFYAPAQIVRDAIEHGVTARPPDVNRSGWDCGLEPEGGGRYALRLGLRQIKGLSATDAARLIEARGLGDGGFIGLDDVWRRAGLSRAALETLARADAFGSLGLDRRRALWAIQALEDDAAPPLFALTPAVQPPEPEVALPVMSLGEQVVMDYVSLRLSLKAHPLALLRPRLVGMVQAGRLAERRDGTKVAVAGLVLVRQRPGSAAGVLFITLEDETGVANLVVMPPVFERWRKEILAARLLAVTGRVQNVDNVVHVRVEGVGDRSELLASLDEEPTDRAGSFAKARNFH